MDRAAIGEQVDRILHSTSFAGKTQLAKLLEVLFAQMDSQAALKPDRVIRELWPDETRTKRSADVATEMNRMRKALECYYHGEGNSDPIIISLPNRSAHATDGPKEKRWIVAEPRDACQKAATEPAAEAASRGRLKLVAAIAAIAVLVVAGYLFRRMFAAPDQPQSARLDGSTLIVMNAKGEELWRKAFPDGFWPQYYSQGLAQRTWFGNLDGKGHSDVLFLYLPAVNPISHSTTLICYSDRGQEKWRWTPGRELPELAGNPATYRTVAFGVLKAPPGQPSRIVVSSYHVPEYPHQIAILDANGKKLSEYWHSGHLDYLTLADLDGDGRQEIIAPGISNGYRQATLIVLDPDRLSGASTEAARPEIQLHGMGVPQERIRLLFPRSDLNKALSVYNQSGEATVDHGRTRLAVSECQSQGCEIWYAFDKNFDLVAVEASDQFRSAHAEFYRNDAANHPFSPAEENQFQKVRCLVGCKTDFVPVNVK
jgi:hypothetical protein